MNEKIAKIVDWSKIPTLNEFEKHLKMLNSETTSETIMFGIKEYEELPHLKHKTDQVSAVSNLYEENGFETKRVVQDPLGHPGPTVACPIGFPSNLYKKFHELKRFNRWICRLHVEIGQTKDGEIISIPHIEQDPLFHPWAHFREAFIKGNVVRGKVALEVLDHFVE